MLPIVNLALSLSLAAAPPSGLTVPVCNAGEHQQFETVTCDIELRNAGDNPIRVFDATPVSHLDRIDSEVVVAPRATAYLRATVMPVNAVGYAHRFFRFKTDEAGVIKTRSADVQMFLSTVLDQASPKIDLGTVRLGNLPPAQPLALSSREVDDFRILEILSKPDFADVAIADDHRTLRVSVREGAPWGTQHDRIKLKINAPKQPEAWVDVDVNVQGHVIAEPDPVLLGLMRTDKQHEFLIRLTNPAKKPFRVGKLDVEGLKGTAKQQPCVPKAKGCAIIKVTVANDQPQGRVGGDLRIELPDFGRTLPVRLGGGLLLGPEVPIHDVEREAAKAAASGASSGAPATAASQPDLKQTIAQAVERKEMPDLPGRGPLLRWNVAHQAGYYGFIIYRAASESGPFARVNPELLRVVDESESRNGSYQWRDTTAVPGTTYWYQIGLVREDGEKVPLSGAQKVVAK